MAGIIVKAEKASGETLKIHIPPEIKDGSLPKDYHKAVEAIQPVILQIASKRCGLNQNRVAIRIQDNEPVVEFTITGEGLKDEAVTRDIKHFLRSEFPDLPMKKATAGNVIRFGLSDLTKATEGKSNLMGVIKSRAGQVPLPSTQSSLSL